MLHQSATYTVESVTSGHPDKVCDQISDAILDACLSQDQKSRVAVETFGSHGLLVLGGEVTTKAKVDYEAIARNVYRDIGYNENLEIRVHIVEQSPDIAMGVDTGGAGDQGIMYGYATDETSEYLQKGVVLVHRLTRGLEEMRKSGALPWLGPDGKAQVTMTDDRVESVLVSTQHEDGMKHEDIYQEIARKLILPTIKRSYEEWSQPLDHQVRILVNPTGKFVQGGFFADAGLTGRKIMVDTYGGLIPHGGGAFSGKDPTKVDRSAAYMARYAAKNIVAGGAAGKCIVSVSYAIGREEPLMVAAIDENGKDISEKAREFDFRPLAIIEHLNLRAPIYQQTAAYGHFGKNWLPWEKIR